MTNLFILLSFEVAYIYISVKKAEIENLEWKIFSFLTKYFFVFLEKRHLTA